jgi:multidrug efflux system membrane fusion protein
MTILFPPRIVSTVGAVALLAIALVGCNRSATPAVERPPAPVAVVTAVQQDVPVYLEAVGKAVAHETVAIQPQVSGRITAIHFADGADLQRGALLFTIDPRPLEAAVEQVEANVARDQAQVRQAEANAARDQAQASQAQAAVGQAQAQLRQAEANVVRDTAQLENARAQERRYAELVRQGYVAREQYDQVKTAMETAQATVHANQAMVENSRAAIAAAEATLGQARAAIQAGQAAIENARAAIRADQAAVESARLQLAYTQIRSPIDGRAGQRLVDIGNIVTANTGTLLTIQRIDPIYADFTVTENDLGAVQRQMAQRLTAEVRLPDDPASLFTGTLTFLDNAVQDGTGTVKLRATVPNPDRRLWPGRFVKVRLVLSRLPAAVLIPAAAPQTSARGPFVYVVTPENTAELRPVTLGQRQGDLVVVTQGVKAGERVVTSGQIAVAPGGKVRIDAAPPGGQPPTKPAAQS